MADKLQAENEERQRQEEEMKKRLKDAQEVSEIFRLGQLARSLEINFVRF